jgi:hypothetical protein
MTIYAVVPNPGTSARVPVAAHAPVGPMLVVSVLRAMALRAQAKCVTGGQQLSICQAEARGLARGVARGAFDWPVREFHPNVKLIESCYVVWYGRSRAQRVTCLTAHALYLAVSAVLTHVDGYQAIREVHFGLHGRDRRCPRPRQIFALCALIMATRKHTKECR